MAPDLDNSSSPLHPLAQEIKQRQFKRTVDGKMAVADPKFLAQGPHGGRVSVQSLQVSPARRGGVNEQVAARLDIVKHHRPVKIEGEFRRIENIKQQDFMAARDQGPQIL